MATKRCPNCKLVKPASAVNCDCGLSFADGTMGEPLNPEPGDPADNRDRRNNRKVAWVIFGSGLALMLFGVALAGSGPRDAGIGFVMAGGVVTGVGRLRL